MKFFICLILVTTSNFAFTQSDLRQVPVSSLPEYIQSTPNVSMAFRWTDSLGDNVLIISKRIVKKDEEDRVRTKAADCNICLT